jgi:leucyl aminopeptidase
VGVFEDTKLTDSAKLFDKASGGYISKILKHGAMSGKEGEALLLHEVPGNHANSVLLIGCGKPKELRPSQYKNVIKTAVNALNTYKIAEACVYLNEIELPNTDKNWLVSVGSEAFAHGVYVFSETKSEKVPAPALKKLTWSVDKDEVKAASKAAKTGLATANGMNLTRELGNLPGNICTPTYLGHQAKKLGSEFGLKVNVLGQKQIEELKMGSFLSVSLGSRQPPRLIVMHYHGAGDKAKPIVLVGKGVTFDSGGISIKPGAAMDEMKFDMCGAASVFGVMRTLAELKPKINVIGIVPSCENLPDGSANKPGDVVTSMSGQTIEILNTDAEGRLILCDALTYSEKFKPRAVIDIATLTGACVIALGKQACGVLGNDQPLVDKLLQAGQASADRAWQMPLWEEYQEQLKSNFADMANIGGREGGAITAACFLARFTKKLKWAHLDIAGVAWDSGLNKGATGRPVPLLVNYLLQEAGY